MPQAYNRRRDHGQKAGRRINMARKERSWTSERLSEACSINATYLRHIESGVKMPSLPVFVSICKALGVSPSYLLADALPNAESQDIAAIMDLCKQATPKQSNMIYAMINSALGHSEV